MSSPINLTTFHTFINHRLLLATIIKTNNVVHLRCLKLKDTVRNNNNNNKNSKPLFNQKMCVTANQSSKKHSKPSSWIQRRHQIIFSIDGNATPKITKTSSYLVVIVHGIDMQGVVAMLRCVIHGNDRNSNQNHRLLPTENCVQPYASRCQIFIGESGSVSILDAQKFLNVVMVIGRHCRIVRNTAFLNFWMECSGTTDCVEILHVPMPKMYQSRCQKILSRCQNMTSRCFFKTSTLIIISVKYK